MSEWNKQFFINPMDGRELYGILATMDFIDFFVIIPGAIGCLLTALFYSIWTNGDKISTPIHTAVVDQAKNYYIDDLRVYHMNIVKNWRGLEAVADILKGRFQECGLQSYPSESGCNKGTHEWQPIRTPLAYKREYLWSCENKSGTRTCDCQQTQMLKPPLLGSNKDGCSVGKRDADRYMHTWRKTGLKKYECKKCRRTCKVYSKPKSAAGTNKCDLPFKNSHRWCLKTREWKCVECAKIVNSKHIPQYLGCKIGITAP